MSNHPTFSHLDSSEDSFNYYPKSVGLGDPALVEIKPSGESAFSVWLPQLPALRLAKELIEDNLSAEESAMLLTILRNKIKAVEDTPSAKDRQAIIDKYKFNFDFHLLSKPLQNLIDDTIRANK